MAHPVPQPPPPPQKKKLMSTKYLLGKYFEIHFEIIKMMEREQKQIKQMADVEPRVARGSLYEGTLDSSGSSRNLLAEGLGQPLPHGSAWVGFPAQALDSGFQPTETQRGSR